MGMEFELKLGGVTYKCTATQYNKDASDCNIQAEINGLKVHISIPIEEKISRTKAIIFIEAFHEALTKAVKDQKLGELQYGKHNVG